MRSYPTGSTGGSRSRRQRRADGTVELSLADRGTGIPPEEMQHIFEPFFTSKADGLGLGLSICRSIVTAHEGRLWADNNGDGGATFHLRLPVLDASAEQG